MLARLGTALPVEPIADRERLVESFDLAAFGLSGNLVAMMAITVVLGMAGMAMRLIDEP